MIEVWIRMYYLRMVFICLYFFSYATMEVYGLFISTKGLEIHADRRWEVRPIGKVQGSYVEKNGVPKQATILEKNTNQQQQTANIILFEEFSECIYDLDGFDYVWVISYMHLNKGYKKKIKTRPRCGNQTPKEVGLFATRAPHRPNALALSALKLCSVDIEKRVLTVQGISCFNVIRSFV